VLGSAGRQQRRSAVRHRQQDLEDGSLPSMLATLIDPPRDVGRDCQVNTSRAKRPATAKGLPDERVACCDHCGRDRVAGLIAGVWMQAAVPIPIYVSIVIYSNKAVTQSYPVGWMVIEHP
jgi:hypothetical protein